MEELTSGVSWLGVVSGAVVAFLIGWGWYSPKIFGTKWAEGVGVDLGSASDMPVGALLSQLVGLFLMSWFVGVTAVANALLTAILATVAFGALAYSGGMFAQKSAYARGVEAGYLAVSLIVMIVCQGIF